MRTAVCPPNGRQTVMPAASNVGKPPRIRSAGANEKRAK